MKLREIADALGCQLQGDGDLEITGVAGMEQAGPDQLTFLANPKYAHKVKDTRAGAILAAEPIPSLPLTLLHSLPTPLLKVKKKSVKISLYL